MVGNIADREKLNLLMAVNEEGIVYFEISEKATNAESFLEFMEMLIEVIANKLKKPYVIVLDNLSCHKTKELYDFYANNKINVIFNTPYLSIFNSIELAFRNLKGELYSCTFESASEMKKKVEEIFKSEEYNKSIHYNFRETLEQYLKYSINNKDFDLNHAEII